jgi:hypothetical protein
VLRRPILLWRVLLVGFAVAYVLSGDLQAWLPPLLPFLGAAAVEAQFFLAGLRADRSRQTAPDRGPQQRDLDELGWAGRTVTVELDDAELVLRPGEMEPEEIGVWIERHRDALDALGPGRHELARIETLESPPSLYLPANTGRSRRTQVRLLQAFAVLILLAGLFFLDTRAAHWQRLPTSARAATVTLLNEQASRIAGHRAAAICDVSGRHVGYVQDADGLAIVGGHTLWLTPEICYRIYLVKHSAQAGAGSGEAIAVFAHEAWHLQGQANEAVTNCFAYQSGVSVGEALGLSPTRARQLMREQLADNPANFAATPQYIVPSGCHRGGSLDLHLDGSHFP